MNYHDITYDDMKNGDGLRAVLWVAGCSHHCKGCQNPVTWDPDDGLLFDEDAQNELMSILDRRHISGLTLSGGDPLYEGNVERIDELCREIKQRFPGKTIWLYTGFDWEEVAGLDVMKYVDICVDGRYVEELRDIKLKWRGSCNQRVIDVKKTLASGRVVLYCD